MYYEDPWDDDGGLIIDLQPGMQHMDGKTAVTYVRYRDEEGDIGRIKRQQKFMKACMDKVTSPAIIPKLPSVIGEVMSSVKTDLSFRQLLEFAGTLKEAQKNGLKTEMVPGKPLYIDGVSYWIPDLQKLRTTLAETLGITLNASEKAQLERTQHEYESSIRRVRPLPRRRRRRRAARARAAPRVRARARAVRAATAPVRGARAARAPKGRATTPRAARMQAARTRQQPRPRRRQPLRRAAATRQRHNKTPSFDKHTNVSLSCQTNCRKGSYYYGNLFHY